MATFPADIIRKPDLRDAIARAMERENPQTAGARTVFNLPYPPSLNKLYATVSGRRVLSARGHRYKELAAALATRAGVRPVGGPVRLTLKVYRPRKCGDLDNTLKVLLDSITGVGWEDDRQVEHIHAYRFEDKANPRVEVEILDMGKVADEIAAAELAVDWLNRVRETQGAQAL